MSSVKQEKAEKPKIVEKKNAGENQGSGRGIMRKVAPMLSGLALLGAVALHGCSDEDDNGVADAGNPCTEVLTEKGKQCISKEDSGVTCAFQKVPVDSGVSVTSDAGPTDASSTAQELVQVCMPVTQTDGGADGMDATSVDGPVGDSVVGEGVVGDALAGDSDAASPCASVTANVADVKTTKNVEINNVSCGQDECEGVLSVGDTLDMNGATYTVKSIDNSSGMVVAESGDYTLEAYLTSGKCRVFYKKVDQGNCTDALAGSAVYLMKVHTEDSNSVGRTTLTLSTSSTYSLGANTKQVMLTEKGSAKTVTLGPYVVAKVSLVKSTGGTAFVAVEVTENKNQPSNKPKEPLGMSLDEGKSVSLGSVVYLRADVATDNTNATCTTLKAVLDGVPYTDGYSASINGNKLDVEVQLNDSDPKKSYVALVDTSVKTNPDTVMKLGDTVTINGSNVKFTDVLVNGASVMNPSADAGTAVDASSVDTGSD